MTTHQDIRLPSLVLERLGIRNFRNLVHVDLEPCRRLNVVAGNNGQGKTSLMEAIYFAATSKSFRTTRVGELIHHGASVASVRARLYELDGEDPPLIREQVAAIDEGRRCTVSIDGNRPPTLASFAVRSPVVAFHPKELALSTGPASLRRTLLDRLALFMDPQSAGHRARYAHALRSRQELLHRGSAGGAELDAFEELCAVHGAALTRARDDAAQVLIAEVTEAFKRIVGSHLVLKVSFVQGGSMDTEEARKALQNDRRRDARKAQASFGPHRDDLVMNLGGHSARVVASQGQHRALTLCLKVAESATIAAVRSVEPILLLDDVSSELDQERTAALFVFLTMRSQGQIFLTTTRPDLIVTSAIAADERRDFHVEGGRVL